MPTLPWATPKQRPALAANPTVMASKFQLRDRRDVPAFFVAALRIRRQMLNAPDALGVSLIAKPLKGTFFTLSAWESREHIQAAVVGHPHVETMKRFAPRTAHSLFAFWTPGTDSRPTWQEAHRRLDEEAAKADHR
ncbi:hypothetical protein ASD37_28195 [Mycobacterium sp. Root135]|uniref:DUF3291 domain-containing protein n=1 Tax=Mycobacterium sp. Root135 TaxID=1736457 RepID=UPI0006F58503|nr:DUF3291 domain-containing protein [Mycobacterium sp. Root135]KQY03360.1 hypothetical protein ASD37_28195 [Mycobacterium sp. Root135]